MYLIIDNKLRLPISHHQGRKYMGMYVYSIQSLSRPVRMRLVVHEMQRLKEVYTKCYKSSRCI